SKCQWYRRDGCGNWESIKGPRRVADATIDVAADKPARITAPVTWGRYRLEVSTGDTGGAMTTFSFDAGFYAEASADTPDLLELALDKPEYRAGDTMTVAVTARSAGKLTLNVVGDRVVHTSTKDVQVGLNRIPVTVGHDWGNGAYLVATLRRPLDAKENRMPGRALGLQWFSIDRKAKSLAVNLTMPAVIRPHTTPRLPL